MDIDHPITFSEVDKAINKLKLGKAPGLNGIPPEAYKAFGKKMQMRIHRYVGQFFDGTRDYDGWHKSQCVSVPKKGNLADTTNGEASCSWMSAVRSLVQL